MKHADFAVMLRLNPLFGELSAPIIEVLARMCSSRSLRAGATLFQKGDPGDALYGVRRGQIGIETGTRAGQRHTLALLGPGDLFGEIALLDGKGRTADAVATQPTELFALRRHDVLEFLAREPRVGITLIEILCQRLRELSGQIEQSLTMRLDARTHARLLLLAEDFGDDIAITQEQLARSVGATRESVNRLLRRWEAAGVLDLRRGFIQLKDRRAFTTVQGSTDRKV